MTDEPAPTPDLHHPDNAFETAAFENWEPIGERVDIIDAADEHGLTVRATATSTGTVAIETLTTQNDAGDPIEPVKMTLQLDPAALIRLAALVPPELLSQHAGADVIHLHPSPIMHDVVVEENGKLNVLCQANGCERRIEYVQPPAAAPVLALPMAAEQAAGMPERTEDAEPEPRIWVHVPDAMGLTPQHEPVPPDDVLERLGAATDGPELELS